MINTATLTVRLGKDVQLRHTTTGKQIASTTAALSMYRPAGDWATLWLKLEAWGRLAEKLETVKTGEEITVTGSLDEDVWTDNNGQERRQLVLKANGIHISKKPTDQTQHQAQQQPIQQEPTMSF